MIDARIRGGDVSADSGAGIEMIDGADARFQRALICMTVPKGSLIYDRELGVSPAASREAAKVELTFNEALAKYENTAVSVTGVTDEAAETVVVIDGESRETEVRSYGNL